MMFYNFTIYDEESEIPGKDYWKFLDATAKELEECGIYFYDFTRVWNSLKNEELKMKMKDKLISLIKAKNDDLDNINNLNEIFFGDIWKESNMPEEEAKNNIITYLIKLNDNIIGKIKTSEESNSVYISGFGILPEYRGMGYGKSALIQVLSNLNKDKIYNVELDVEVKNKKALNLYKDCGFIEGSIMNYYNINI